MSTMGSARDDMAVEAARLGAMLAGRGLTPDQVAAVMREMQPVLDEAVRLVEEGVPLDEIRFGLDHPGRS